MKGSLIMDSKLGEVFTHEKRMVKSILEISIMANGKEKGHTRFQTLEQ